MKKKRLILLGCICIMAVIALLIWLYPQGKEIKKDFERLQSEEYDTLVLAMFPIDYYDESDYTLYRAMDAVQMSYSIPNGRILKKYINTAKESGNPLQRVYMGIDPERISKEDVTELIQGNPEIFFEVVLPYPQIDYWTGMKEKEFEEVMQIYRDVMGVVLSYGNTALYSYGSEEWLVANSKNYVDEYNTNESVSEFLMCNTDDSHPYGVNLANADAVFADYKRLYDKYRNHEGYPDFNGTEIIFFGDSIIGNFTNSLSVPEVVSALSGAKVYNLGFGGKSAALSECTEVAFPQVVEAFLTEDVKELPEDSQVYAGVQTYAQQKDTDAPKIFVINYGLNDYFYGVPLERDDPYDAASYAGALRAGIKALQEVYPEAEFMLMTPHFSINFNFGKDVRGEFGGNLEAYANTAVAVAKEMNIEMLDNFRELGISEENWEVYQDDGTHPNEKGRFMLGEKIVWRINEIK